MDPALDEDEPELGVDVRPVPLEVLPDGDGLLDEEVEVLGHLGGQPARLEQAHDLGARDGVGERDAVGVAEQRADLRRHLALLGGAHDELLHLRRGGLDPGRGLPLVGEHRGRHALAVAVHASHGGERERKRGRR